MKLINKIKITALFLMTVSLSSAQNNIEGGLKVSFNMPSSCEKGVDGVSGVSFGYFETLYLTERLALQGEINFSEFGFEKKIGEGDTAFTEETDISLVEIPVLLSTRLKLASGQALLGGGVQYTRGDITEWVPVIDLSIHINEFRLNARYINYKDEFGFYRSSNFSVGIGFVFL